MEVDVQNEIFEFFRDLCLMEGIVADFRMGREQRIDVNLGERKISFNIHLLNSVTSETPGVREIVDWQVEPNILQVQLWEDQWVHQKSKVKSKIRSLLGLTQRIHARATKIKKIDNSTLVQFLNQNHLNIAIKGKYKYGLYDKEELVAVMSFSKGRTMVRDEKKFASYELLRFCNKLNCTVVGGFSKLLRHFIKVHKPDDLMTYVDADWSNGKSLTTMGFDYVETKEPFEFWLNLSTGIREYPHLVIQKHRLFDDQQRENIDNFLIKNKYIKIYNSGSYKFLLKLK